MHACTTHHFVICLAIATRLFNGDLQVLQTRLVLQSSSQVKGSLVPLKLAQQLELGAGLQGQTFPRSIIRNLEW